MIEICVALVICSLLLAAGLVIAIWTRSEKRRKQGSAIIVVSVVLLASTGVLGIMEYVAENGLPIPDYWGGEINGSAAALYRNYAVIPADNGSVFVAWSSNAGKHYTSQDQRAAGACDIHIAKIGPSGTKSFDRTVGASARSIEIRYMERSRFQDGFLFFNVRYPMILDSNATAASGLKGTAWQSARIYQFPSGPLMFPWDKAPVDGSIINNALTDPAGNITFLSESIYPEPFSGGPNSTVNGLFCSVINGSGSLLVNQTRLPAMGSWLRVPVFYGMDLDPSGRLILAAVAGPDWQQDNATHFVVNAFGANLTIEANVSLDQAGGFFESMNLLDVQSPEENHIHMLISRTYVEGHGTSKEQYVVLVDLAEISFPDGQSPSLRMTNLVTSPSSLSPEGALDHDGRTVYLAGKVKDELYLKSFDTAGTQRFNDVRLTPTNDRYSWNYPSNW